MMERERKRPHRAGVDLCLAAQDRHSFYPIPKHGARRVAAALRPQMVARWVA